jgi:hypothetical protein
VTDGLGPPKEPSMPLDQHPSPQPANAPAGGPPRRTCAFLVRLTDDEFAAIRAHARESRRPLARYAREVLLGASVRASRGADHAALVCALEDVGVALARLAERETAGARALGVAPVAVTLRALLDRIDALLARR